MRRRGRILVGLGLGLAVALVLLAFGLFPQRPLRGLVESKLQELIGPESRVGSLQVVPGRLSAEIRGLVLDSPTYRLEADHVRVALSARTLRGEGLFVERLEMDGGHIVLRTPAEPVPPSRPFEGPLVVRNIAIRGVTLTYDDPDLGGVITLRPVDVRGSIGEGTLTATAEGGTWRRADPVTIGPLDARLRISSRLDLHLESLDAGLERTRLRASGVLGRVGDLRPDLRFTAGVALDEIAPLAGLVPASGTVSADGRLFGPVDALRVEARLRGANLVAAGWPVERLLANVAHETAGAVTTASADLGVFGGRARLEASLRGTAVRGTLEASGLDLDRLIGRVAGRSPVSGRASLSARLQGDTQRGVDVVVEARASGRDRNRMGFEAVARARGPVRLPRPEMDLAWTAELATDPAVDAALPPARLTARGTARGALPPQVDADVDGTLAVTGAAGPEEVAVTGRVRSQGQRVSADLKLSGFDGTTEARLEATGTRASTLEVTATGLDLARVVADARGQASLTVRASGPFDALSGTGVVRVTALGWRALDLGTLEAGLTATRGSLRVQAALPRLQATVDATVQPADGGPVRGTLALSGTPLGAVAPLLPEGRPLEGTLTGRVAFDLPLADPMAGSAEGRIEVLEARSGALAVQTARPFSLELADGRLAIEDMELRGRGFAARVDGSAGLRAGGPLDLRAQVEAALADLPVPETWTVAGTARAEVAVGGTRATPRLDGFISLEGVTAESPQVPPVRVDAGRVELQGDALVIPGLVAQVAGGEVRVEGRVPVAAAWREARREGGKVAAEEAARIALEWSGVDAAQLVRRLAPASQATIEASLAGRAELRGGLAALAEMSGTLSLPATAARVQDLGLETAPAEVRLQDGRVTIPGLELRAAGGVLTVAGSADLKSRALDMTGQGTLPLRALSPFLEEAALTGTSTVDLRVGGTLEEPRPTGSILVSDGTLRLRMLPQALTGISAALVLDGRTLRLQEAKAALGGGAITASGQATLEGTALRGARFEVKGRDLALRYPAGMRSRLEMDLALTGQSGGFLLSGTVRALRGLYDLDTALDESLTAPATAAEDSPLLRSVALDILVVTENPVLVRNDLAQLQATGRLTVRGDLQTPAPVGTLEIASGGKVFVQGREFVIGSGRLVYNGNWDPDLAVDATARISDFDQQTGLERADVDVTVSLEGRMSAPRIALRSSPAYSNLEIVNLITTGDSQNTSARLALGGPAATLLAGRLSRTVGSSLGLDQVTIQPELVAREGEVETGARFTFGKRLSSRVNLVYSLSLQDPEGRFIQLEATPGRDVTLSLRRTDHGTITYGAGQRFRFGGAGARTASAEQRVRVVEVRLEGDRPLEPDEMRAAIDTGVGDRKTVWDLQEDADRLRERLVERGYLEAEVAARFDGQVAVFTVRSGSRYVWTVEGLSSPPDLTGVIRSALFEEEALERGQERLLEELRGRGHLRAEVEAHALPGETRTLAFEVRPGPRLKAEVRFPGAAALSESRLLAAAGGAGRLLTDPLAAARDVAAVYHDALYLAPEVDPPRVETLDGGRVRIAMPVREGPRAQLAAVRFEGATLPEAELARVASLPEGAPYEAAEAAAAVDRLRGHYYGLGHPSVRINPRVATQGPDVALVLEVAEGPRVTVDRVVLSGLRHTREGLVRRHLTLEPGDPLDPRKVAELERKLLDLGLFTRAAATVSEGSPATVTVTLEEGDRVRAGYLATYDDDRGSLGELDGEVRNLLGAGLSVGGRLSLGRDLRDARAALSVPSLLLPTGRVTASVFRLAEDLPLVAGEEDGPTFERLQTGGQIQGTRPFGGGWNVLYGYRLKKVEVVSEFLTSSHTVAGVDVSLLRDTRDNPLDTRRGRFWSVSLELSPQALGSDFDFVKGYAQAFFTRPLTGSLSWAQGYRLGLAHAFGGEPLVADEGFEAGGANSIRGFDTNEVGPEGYPFGKQAVIVLNQELRYRHASGLGGVVFYDGGNTFETARDFSLDLRHVFGAGLRWVSPVGLLRLDVGAPLFPREGESRVKVFFSFGQAF